MNAHVVGFVRFIRLNGGLRLHEIDVLPDFCRAHVLVQIAVGQEQNGAKVIKGEITACTLHSVFPFAVAVNDPLDPFGGNALSVVHHLYQDEFAVSAVGFIHVENRVGGGAGTGEGVENYIVIFRTNLNHSLNQLVRFRGCKGNRLRENSF